MSLHNLIAQGGKVLVLGGYDKDWPDFREHPQLEFWSGDSSYEIGAILRRHNNCLPANVRAVVISRFVSHSQLALVMKQVRKRNLTCFPNKNTGEVKRILTEIINGIPAPVNTEFINKPRLATVTAKPQETKVETETRTVEVPTTSKAVAKPEISQARPGSIKALVVELDDPKLLLRTSADAIFKIAQETGVKTTWTSVEQTIRFVRKENGTFVPTRNFKAKAPAPAPVIEVPKTVKPVESKAVVTDNLVTALNDAIAALQLVKELAQKQQTENEQLRTYKERMIKRVATLLSPEEDAK